MIQTHLLAAGLLAALVSAAPVPVPPPVPGKPKPKAAAPAPVASGRVIKVGHKGGDVRTLLEALTQAQSGDTIEWLDAGMIGATLTQVRDGARVVSVDKDGPADKAGLKPGDDVILIDGEAAINLGLAGAVRALAGRPGTAADLRVRRAGQVKAEKVLVARAPRRAAITTERSKLEAASLAGDEKTALAYARRLAKQGDHSGDAYLAAAAYAEFEKTGRAAAGQTAVSLAEAGAKAGDPVAERVYGAMLLEGKALPLDHAAGADWLQKAAEAGDAPAAHALGLAYAGGIGVPNDRARALKLLEKAAAAGDLSAQADLDRLKGVAR